MVRLPFNWGSSNRGAANSSAGAKNVPHHFKNYYYILAVSRKANTKEIEQAYAKLLEKYGPHVNISECDPELQITMLKDIKEAYRVLMNPAQRKVYDVQLTRYFGNEDAEGLPKRTARE